MDFGDTGLLQTLMMQFFLNEIPTLEFRTQEFTEQYDFCYSSSGLFVPQSLPKTRMMECFCLAPSLFPIVLPSPNTRINQILMTITSLLKFTNIFFIWVFHLNT